ncbi:MAG: hypothetical protein EXS47_02730, partial [Candidatus Zambryskibacteria bacterium]|nr:hypothetical protein [Candidatus Zambryskibacteria bacterium]
MINSMNSEVYFEGKKYISIKEASALTSYSKDYIGQLSRQGKVTSKRLGKKWFVEAASLLDYKNTPTTFDFSKNFQGREKLLEESNRFIPIIEASILTGYSKDYIGQLARFNKIDSKRDGKKWLVSESSLIKYKNTPTSFDFSKNFQGKVSVVPVEVEIVVPETVNDIAFEFCDLKPITPSVFHSLHNFLFSSDLNFAKSLTPLSLVLLLVIGSFSLQDKAVRNISNKANVISTITTPLNSGSTLVYSGINNLIDKTLYSPLSRFFGTPAVATPTYIVQRAATPTPAPTVSKTVFDTKVLKSISPQIVTNTRTVERIIERFTPSDVTKSYVDLSLQTLKNNLTAEFGRLSFGTGGAVTNIYNQIAHSQKIDNLYNTAISNPTVTGGSITGTSVSATGISADSITTPSITVTNGTITNLVVTNGTVTNLNLTNSTTTNATTTSAYITSLVGVTASTTFSNIGTLTFGGVTASTWPAFCNTITGSASLCDGDDATGSGGSSAFEIATTSDIAISQIGYFTKTAGRTILGGVATSSLSVGASLLSSGTLGFQIGGTASSLSLNLANANSWTALQTFANASTTIFSANSAQFGGTATSTLLANGNFVTNQATSTN